MGRSIARAIPSQGRQEVGEEVGLLQSVGTKQQQLPASQ